MKLLVLGGTAFVGRSIVEAALAAGHEVTTFNRGRSGADIPGVATIRGDRTDPESVAAVAHQEWDAVFDTSGYTPRNVLAVARALEPVAGRYVFMSTVSVYADWPVKPLTEDSSVLECPPDAGPDFGEDVEDGPTQYGYQKSGCEEATRLTFGVDRATCLRPGVVLGPHEYVGRLPWWLRRVAAGGDVVAPGDPDRSIQPVDVRDLAAFALHCATVGQGGDFNVSAPIGRETFADFLTACRETTGSDARLRWVPDEVLLRHGVRQWSEMPLWRTFEGVWNVDSSRALAAGLSCRPIAETVAGTWSWVRSVDEAREQHERAAEIGLGAAREREILASLS
ncbi:NAD-dependent epimerase/dehydratase family protein [Phytomonospora endophytica]|uniref:Nucleoside-diphosphate-sugar epimerase n=1 Tax=Phytomonospora endophytica TaxID=714109 RepID=A0A841FXG2_9ACTN|nr:NAD-dependent epimerase/dehydratase family protein [Phytomonospora endophytica]MBB6038222.1 nucleoside-diphosphate-sugar epimerase [Phytomonospora endophytica]GIG67319.1 reductase [Phytomonospora endophytica]